MKWTHFCLTLSQLGLIRLPLFYHANSKIWPYKRSFLLSKNNLGLTQNCISELVQYLLKDWKLFTTPQEVPPKPTKAAKKIRRGKHAQKRIDGNPGHNTIIDTGNQNNLQAFGKFFSNIFLLEFPCINFHLQDLNYIHLHNLVWHLERIYLKQGYDYPAICHLLLGNVHDYMTLNWGWPTTGFWMKAQH